DGIVSLMYTGGTTGRSKGVIWHDNAILSMIFLPIVGWELPRVPRLIVALPLSHAAVSAALPVLQLGGTVIILPRFNAEEFLDAMERHKANCTFIVPTALYALMDSPTIDERDFSTMETLVYGAAPISPERLKEEIVRFDPILVQNYGQTETTHLTTMAKRDHDASNEQRLMACGRPHYGVDIRITDPFGDELPMGEVGEICARTPGGMSGYWKRPEDNASTLVGGWIRTGDV